MKMINKRIVKKQQGIALLMSLIMLVLVTLIGVASVRLSSADTQVSGNSIFSLMVFQGAESALGKVTAEEDAFFNIQEAANRSLVPFQIDQAFFNNPTETVNDGVELTTTAEMVFESDFEGALIGDLPTTTDAQYQIFRTTAESRLDGTSARAVHTIGIAILKPTP